MKIANPNTLPHLSSPAQNGGGLLRPVAPRVRAPLTSLWAASDRGRRAVCRALTSAATALAFIVIPLVALGRASATSISFQGVLNGTGGLPLPNGSYTLGFQFWDHPTSTAAGNRVGSAVTVPSVAVNGGVASTAIPVHPEWFDGQTRYLGITIQGVNGGQEFGPRVLVTAVPYAVRALRLAEGQDLFVNRLGIFTFPHSGSYVFLDAKDPWGPGGMVGCRMGLLTGTEPRTASVELNGGIYDPVLCLPQPQHIGHSFFKVGGTHHNGHVNPVPFNAGSISLEVASVGPGSRYSSALRFQTLGDSYANNLASEKMAIMGDGTVLFGSGADGQNAKVVLRGPKAPANSTSRADISFQFSSAGSAEIRSYRGGSWDTYLEFWTSRPNPANPATPLLERRAYIDHEGRFFVFGTTITTVLQITSAREAKQDFAPVDAAAILAKVAALPLSTWVYTNAPTVRHLGPVAQDFHAAFGLGDDDQHIATVDADGVSLVAIQGLHQLVREKEARVAQLESAALDKETRIAGLESRLTALERLVQQRQVVSSATPLCVAPDLAASPCFTAQLTQPTTGSMQ